MSKTFKDQKAFLDKQERFPKKIKRPPSKGRFKKKINKKDILDENVIYGLNQFPPTAGLCAFLPGFPGTVVEEVAKIASTNFTYFVYKVDMGDNHFVYALSRTSQSDS